MNGRKVVSVTIALSLLTLIAPAWGKEAKAEFKVSGMSCEICAKGVQAQLAKLPGVKSATVSYEDGTATVIYDDSTVTVEKLKETIEKSGFRAELQSEEPKATSSAKQAAPRSRTCCGVCPIGGATAARSGAPVGMRHR